MLRSVGRRLCLLAAAAAVLLLAGVAPAAGAAPSYYVSLGDSLAAGYQPGGDTDHGYTDLAASALARDAPGLRAVQFGCTGETVRSLLGRSVCAQAYDSGSQLDAATAFLAAHRGRTKYLTIDIGANDVSHCAAGATLDRECAERALAATTTGLATALARLHAADPSVPVTVGLTYYDPFLAASLLGATQLATESLSLQRSLNLIETAVYARYGYRVADVATAFRTGDTTPRSVPNLGRQPTNLAYVCTYTFICTRRDIHPTDAGYRLIAQTVLAAARA